jgi:hypothetical protein
LNDLEKIGGAFLTGSYSYPGKIVSLFGPKDIGLTGSGKDQKLDAAKLLLVFKDGLSKGIKNNKCALSNYSQRSRPKDKDCLADWMYARLSLTGAYPLEDMDADSMSSLKENVEEFVSKTKGPIKSWPKAYSIPFRPVMRGTVRDFSGSVKIFKKLIVENDVLSVYELLLNHSGDLDIVFHLSNDELKNVVTCESFLEKISSVLTRIKKREPKKNSSFMLGLVGRLSNQLCSDKSEMALKRIQESTPQDYSYYSTASWYKEMSPLNVSESDSKDDMLLREQLKLFFHYGSQFDLEDYTHLSEKEKILEIKDSILAFQIRNFNIMPWVHLTQNIEEVDVQRILLEESLLVLGRSNEENKRMLQVAYLEAYDPTPVMDPTSKETKTAVTRIRNLSTVARSVVERAIPLSNRVHNGLHKGLIERTREFIKTLKGREKKHKRVFSELERALVAFFAIDKTPIERLEIHLNGISTAKDAVGLLKSKAETSLVAIERLVSEELKRIESLKLQFPKKDMAIWHVENKRVLSQYVSSIRALRELSIIARAKKIDKLAHVSGFSDSSKIIDSMRDRIALFKWYLFVQSKRFSTNGEVRKAYKDRLKKINKM